jgi:hypothetical protein
MLLWHARDAATMASGKMICTYFITFDFRVLKQR